MLNVLKLYQALSRHFEQVPVDRARFPNFSMKVQPILAKGSAGPLEGDLHSAQYFHGRDGLGEISERHPDLNADMDSLPRHPYLRITDKPGDDVALDLLRSHPPRSIAYIALGPLTNLAHMMQKDGDLVRKNIGRIICMGGAVDVPGNTSPMAEFNFFADPYAVKDLLLSLNSRSALPLDRFLLLPLDITTPHELPFLIYKQKVDPTFDSTALPSVAGSKTPLVHFTSSFLERTREIMLRFGKDAMELHDIVAVWCALENPPNQGLSTEWRVKTRVFDIERTGEITRGMLVVDRREDETAYSPGQNRARVQTELQERYDATAFPIENETGNPLSQPILPGVPCVTATPGPSILLDTLLKRVWGIELKNKSMQK